MPFPGGYRKGLEGSPNSTYKNTLYRLDKSRSALAEARLKIYLLFSSENQICYFPLEGTFGPHLGKISDLIFLWSSPQENIRFDFTLKITGDIFKKMS